MSYYVGLDVSVKSVTICVVDGEGAIAARGEVSSDPDQIAAFLLEHAPDAARVVHESGILSIWLTRELEKRGLPIGYRARKWSCRAPHDGSGRRPHCRSRLHLNTG